MLFTPLWGAGGTFSAETYSEPLHLSVKTRMIRVICVLLFLTGWYRLSGSVGYRKGCDYGKREK